VFVLLGDLRLLLQRLECFRIAELIEGLHYEFELLLLVGLICIYVHLRGAVGGGGMPEICHIQLHQGVIFTAIRIFA